MASELSDGAKVAIGDFVEQMIHKREERVNKVVGASVFGIVALLLGAFATVRSAAQDAARVEAQKQADERIRQLTDEASEYKKALQALGAETTRQVADALSGAAAAKSDSERLRSRLNEDVQRSEGLSADLAKQRETLLNAQGSLDALLRTVEQQSDRAAGVGRSLGFIESQVGGDLEGKARVVKTMLDAAQSREVGKQIEALAKSIDQSLPVGVILAVNRMWTDADESRTGWYRCDGRTVDGRLLPDLRDRFLKGLRADANDARERPLTYGGSNNDVHTHAGRTMPAGISPHMSAKAQFDSGNRVAPQDITQEVSIGANSTSANPYGNAPAYCAVQFVMRVR